MSRDNRKDNKNTEPKEVYSEKFENDTAEIDVTDVKAAALAYAKYLKEKGLKPGDATFVEPEALDIEVREAAPQTGLPSDADLVFDVRCLPNPYYVDELKTHTGLEQCVRDYVMGFEESKEYFRRITEMITYLLPYYRREGKSELVVAFGCTGGRHRSVCFAEQFAEYMREQGCRVLVSHQELEK